MFGIHDYRLFLIAGILLNITPGQDTFYVLGRTIAQGGRAGIASVLGIACGSVVHTLAAAVGLSAILVASASAFLVVKIAGAAYLAYLGLSMVFKRRPGLTEMPELEKAPTGAILRQGFVTNLLNPKVALFFLAFMPQFIDAASPNKATAFILLGLSFIITGTLWCLCLVWFSTRLSVWLRRKPQVATLLERSAGALFVWLGIRLATEKSP